jgi:heme-degrading monooxygenase HmoA
MQPVATGRKRAGAEVCTVPQRFLRRDVGDRTEFVMFTLWDSLNAVKAFAGEDYETAVFYPEDERFLVERDLTSTHYNVEGHVADPGSD